MFLIDTREPPPPEPPGLPPWEPNWLMWGWIALAAACFAAATLASGLLAFAAICATVLAACRAATAAVGYGGGLREHRQ